MSGALTVDEHWKFAAFTWIEYSITAQLLGWRHNLHACVFGRAACRQHRQSSARQGNIAC
jgi:hypothetical protein